MPGDNNPPTLFQGLQESLTERLPLIASERGSRCTLVSYPEQDDPERNPLITNPALVAELSLFLATLLVGFVLMYATNSGDTPRLFEYGIIFFNAGLVPAITSVAAPFVRNPNISFGEALESKDIVVYLMFVAVGVVMIVVDNDAFANGDNDNEGGNWRLLIGQSLLEAGLVYFAVRSFLINEAPEDRARKLEEEVLYLRESISKGISESYFLNFVKWIGKDMIRSREANQGLVEFQTQGSDTELPVKQDVRAMVVVVPILQEIFDEEQGEEGNHDRMFSDLQDRVEQLAQERAVRGSIAPVGPNRNRFSRAQTTLKLTVLEPSLLGGGSSAGSSPQQKSPQPRNEATVFLDIPTTLLTVYKNIKGNSRFRTAQEEADAFARDARRFSNQLVWNLQRGQELDDQNDLVLVFEFDGYKDEFANTLDTALAHHFFGSAGNRNVDDGNAASQLQEQVSLTQTREGEQNEESDQDEPADA